MMDYEDILGEWLHEDEGTTVWMSVGTDQTIINFMQLFGMEPAEGGIGISGSVVDTMDHMYLMSDSFYGYEMYMVVVSNNPFDMTDMLDDDYDYDDDYDDIPEDIELPMVAFMYMSMMGFEGGAFTIADTVNGAPVAYEYEIENAGDYISIDSTSLRVDIAEITVSNDAGDSTYTISGSIAPGTMDLVADTPFEVPFMDDFGPDPDDEESLTFQFFDDNSGLEIYSGYEDDDYYYYEWTDTSEFEWSATDDSITLIFPDYDEDDYGYYYEESDTITLAYSVENDMLIFEAEFDYCEMEFDEDDYYYDSLDCYGYFEEMYGMTDVQEVIVDFWMEMSYVGPLSINDAVSLTPRAFKLHHAYPNPFNPTTTLAYEIGSVGNVDIKVYDVYGKEINSLFSGTRLPGRHEVTWDAKDSGGRQVSSGVYLFKVTANGKTQTAKTLLLK